MTEINGFKLLGNKKAQVLILGSMPSVTSLEKQQYYGHTRNVFWRIMAALFNEDKALNYQQGQQLLQVEGIAIWDVLKSCERQGSLDADIKKNSIKINDFIAFFEVFKQVRFVFFNGGTAELLYKKHVYPLLPVKYRTLNYTKLPSTSPAYAAMCYQDKLAAWTALKKL
ncbi:MAG: DNA-deoxyinosine glycosylase [Methyloprofundus sp.]|nr:DNA-deoxyinosine glycosylase [Methyloprofundus sp.]